MSASVYQQFLKNFYAGIDSKIFIFSEELLSAFLFVIKFLVVLTTLFTALFIDAIFWLHYLKIFLLILIFSWLNFLSVFWFYFFNTFHQKYLPVVYINGGSETIFFAIFKFFNLSIYFLLYLYYSFIVFIIILLIF